MPPAREDGHRVRCRLTDLLAARGMTVAALSDAVGISVVNLSVLKNDRARAVRFTTLTALCDVLDCQPTVEPAFGHVAYATTRSSPGG